MNDPYLSGHLIDICNVLLELDENDATAIFGKPDDMKLLSSMTLFEYAARKMNISVFSAVLEKFFEGKRDYRTLRYLDV